MDESPGAINVDVWAVFCEAYEKYRDGEDQP